jgi:hypothetical protein
MFSLLNFGKKRRSRRKGSRKGSKKSRRSSGAKPPARLLKICRKYKVKSTKKVGSRRVYKSIRVLKKACLKKVRAAQKACKRRAAAFGARRRTRTRMYAFGSKSMGLGSMMTPGMGFGKARRSRGRKVSKAAAMKAFRQFYKRHCAAGRGSRFGNGGNPALSASMGYQFCPSGMGGVLGANSTGMFPTPCMSMNQEQAAAEAAVALPPTSFGRRHRTRRTRKASAFGKKRKSHRKSSFGKKRKSTKRTRKGRKAHRRRRSTAIGARRRTRRTRRRTTAAGRRTRRRCYA